MSGERLGAHVFVATCYAATVVLVLSTCWLFLSNVDQLVPQEATQTEDTENWRTDSLYLRNARSVRSRPSEIDCPMARSPTNSC